jgi:hypothetical protein
MIAAISSLFILITFSLIENPVYALASVAAPNMIIENIRTEPSPVHVGDYFILNATIKNISNNTISILNFGCKDPIKSLFDANIEVTQAASGVCFNPQQIITLRPGQLVDLLSPDTESYKAIHKGIVKAVLQIDYSMQTDNQTTFSISGNGTFAGFLSKPFTFEVLATPNYNSTNK